MLWMWGERSCFDVLSGTIQTPPTLHFYEHYKVKCCDSRSELPDFYILVFLYLPVFLPFPAFWLVWDAGQSRVLVIISANPVSTLRANCYISETALSITETELPKHFSIQSTPKPEKTCLTNHSGVGLFLPFLRIESVKSFNDPILKFWLVTPTTRTILRSLNAAMEDLTK